MLIIAVCLRNSSECATVVSTPDYLMLGLAQVVVQIILHQLHLPVIQANVIKTFSALCQFIDDIDLQFLQNGSEIFLQSIKMKYCKQYYDQSMSQIANNVKNSFEFTLRNTYLEQAIGTTECEEYLKRPNVIKLGHHLVPERLPVLRGVRDLVKDIEAIL